jgi:hypothetical protein
MRTRRRLGAAAAVGLGALLLATVLASPALAWHSNVTVSARCFQGRVRVHYTVQAWDEGHEATVAVAYQLNGEVTPLQADRYSFAEDRNGFTGHFDLPAGTTGTVTVVAVATWTDAPPSSDKGSAGVEWLHRPDHGAAHRGPDHNRGDRRPLQHAGPDHHGGGRWRGHQHHRGRRPAAVHRGQLRAHAAGRDRPGRRWRPVPAPQPGRRPPPRGQVRLP